MPFQTLVTIDAISFATYASARGIRMTLEPIEQSKKIRRNINGKAIDVSAIQFRKYKASIVCTDQRAPTLTNIFPGRQVVVQCLPDLIGSDSVTPLTLTMLVVDFKVDRNEWGASIGWSLELTQEG